MKNNEIIKRDLKSRGIAYWQVADKLGVSDITLCRHLRRPITDEEYNSILAAADEVESERTNE